jgi:hypothetical protein
MCLGVLVSLICAPTTLTNSSFAPFTVFLGYSNMHKGFKCLDISTGRIYISLDVIFDESMFPFASLNSNAGACYTSDVLLIPSSTPGDNIFTNESNDPIVSCLPFPDIPVQLQQGSILIDV